MSRRRVAITGIGLVTGLGATREETWQALTAGRCAIRPITVFDTDGYRSCVAAEVPMAAVEAQLTPLQRRRWSRERQGTGAGGANRCWHLRTNRS